MRYPYELDLEPWVRAVPLEVFRTHKRDERLAYQRNDQKWFQLLPVEQRVLHTETVERIRQLTPFIPTTADGSYFDEPSFVSITSTVELAFVDANWPRIPTGQPEPLAKPTRSGFGGGSLTPAHSATA